MFDSFTVPSGIEYELVDFFKRQPAFPLTSIKGRGPRDGDPYRELEEHYGVYVLYYRGDFPLYADISERNAKELIKPIYVGKAVSSGSRTGGKQKNAALSDGEEDAGTSDEMTLVAAEDALDPKAKAKQSNSLYKRLNEHRNSINKGRDLRVEEFEVRVIPMADALVQWAEATMIKRLKPIWNAQISGFGNHDPGKGRYEQARSIWDQLHPGRTWALKMANLARYDEDELRHQIRLTLPVKLD